MTEYFKGRQAIYEYLYLAYYKVPDQSFYELTKRFSSVFTALSQINDEFALGNKLLSDFLENQKDVDPETTSLQMNAGFTKLFFMGPDSISLAESQWRIKEIDRTDIILSLSDFFASANLSKPTEINISIDSYSVEMYYLFKTSKQLVEADEKDMQAIITTQISFMDKHIFTWVDRFIDEIILRTENKGFYAAIAHITKAFLNYDYTLMTSD